MKRFTTLLAVASLVFVLSGCGDDDGAEVRDVDGESSDTGSDAASGSGSEADEAACETVGDPAAADSTVQVRLDEFTITPESPTGAPGNIAFAADNEGEDAHELVIVRADAVTDLPLNDEGIVDEEALPDGAFIGEIEKFPGGEVCEGAFDLEPGTYVLFCNILEEEADGTIENHFAKGMYNVFTVE